MNGNKVIRVTFGERIEQAKKKAEEEYQEKLERSKQSDVDVRDFLMTKSLIVFFRIMSFSMEELLICRRCSDMKS